MTESRAHRTSARAAILVVSLLVAAGCESAVATSPPPTVRPATVQPSAPEPPTEGPIETPGPTADSDAPPCALGDLKASHGLVEGAAGSLLTEVLLVSAATCSVDAFPTLVLRDGRGGELLRAAAAGPGSIDLAIGVAYGSQVRLANWCLPLPAFPLTLGIALSAGELAVSGTGFGEADGLPPCNAGDGAEGLVGSAWSPSR